MSRRKKMVDKDNELEDMKNMMSKIPVFEKLKLNFQHPDLVENY